MSFSDRVSDSELAKNCKSATVDGVELEPRWARWLTKSEMSEGMAEEKGKNYYDISGENGVPLGSLGYFHSLERSRQALIWTAITVPGGGVIPYTGQFSIGRPIGYGC